MADQAATTDFTEFMREVEPRLRRALVAAFGGEVGTEAVADALAHGWERWTEVQQMRNPAGYLWGVGRNKARGELRRRRPVRYPTPPVGHEPWIEPGLPGALSRLSESQRAAVLLVHGFEWTYGEVADLWGVSLSTVQKHVDRGMAKLRKRMGVLT